MLPAGYMHFALKYMYAARVHPSEILELTEDIKKTIPKMKRIWTRSPLAMAGRDEQMKVYLDQGIELAQAVKDGKIPMQ